MEKLILCIHSSLLPSEDTISYRLVEELGKKFDISESGDPVLLSMPHGKNLQHAVKICVEKGKKTIKFLDETGNRGIVLAGRPYHIDPEVNHGIPELINSYNIAVLTEDSISHLNPARAPTQCYGSVDVPFPSVCSGKLCKDKRQSGSDPAQLFRLRTGCGHNRSGCGYSYIIQIRSIHL